MKKNTLLIIMVLFSTVLMLGIYGVSATDPIYNTNVQNAAKLDNPLGNVGSIGEFIAVLIRVVLIVAVPLLVVAFIWLGFQFVMAQGNSGELEKVKRNLWYTIIGAAIVLGASAINEVLTRTFEGLAR